MNLADCLIEAQQWVLLEFRNTAKPSQLTPSDLYVTFSNKSISFTEAFLSSNIRNGM